MSREMLTALWITAVGTGFLFASTGALIGLMYLLTAPWLFPQAGRPRRRRRRAGKRRRFGRSRGEIAPSVSAAPAVLVEETENERRRRAVALAVGIACAEHSLMPGVPVSDTPSDWRRLHRAERLSGSSSRRRGVR